MGLGTSEQLLIKAVAENDIREAKKYALAALKNDTTQKNRYFVNKYTSILTMEGSNFFELPSDLKDILVLGQCCRIILSPARRQEKIYGKPSQELRMRFIQDFKLWILPEKPGWENR